MLMYAEPRLLSISRAPEILLTHCFRPGNSPRALKDTPELEQPLQIFHQKYDRIGTFNANVRRSGGLSQSLELRRFSKLIFSKPKIVREL